MNVRQKALKILQEFRSQLDELDMSRQEYTKLQSYSRKVFKKMGELEAEPVETTGGCCDRCKCKCIIPSGEKVDCFNPSCPCHQRKAENKLAKTMLAFEEAFTRETPKYAPKLPEKINQIYYDKNAGEALLRDKINEILDYLEKKL